MAQVSFNWISGQNKSAAPEAVEGEERMVEQLDQNMAEKMRELEQKIVKVASAIREHRETNRALQTKVTALEDEIRAKDDELRRLREEFEQSERMKQNLAMLREERAAMRSQVDDLLREIESIELN